MSGTRASRIWQNFKAANSISLFGSPIRFLVWYNINNCYAAGFYRRRRRCCRDGSYISNINLSNRSSWINDYYIIRLTRHYVRNVVIWQWQEALCIQQMWLFISMFQFSDILAALLLNALVSFMLSVTLTTFSVSDYAYQESCNIYIRVDVLLIILRLTHITIIHRPVSASLSRCLRSLTTFRLMWNKLHKDVKYQWVKVCWHKWKIKSMPAFHGRNSVSMTLQVCL